MELDVHLRRHADEPWGFRLIGGTDSNVPLTVVKVLADSPADRAGLKNGDTVSAINGNVASTMSHDDARQFVGVAQTDLTLAVTRGLYDPVLDDYEPIYETIDQADSDQPSQFNEVFDQLSDIELPIPDSRSLTASPFVPTTKPYRPFSTEPLPEIPPLEDPIILNPSYHDEFAKYGIDEDLLPKTKFKLPISEQYDPDGRKSRMSEYTEVSEKAVEEVMTKNEVEFMVEMQKEIDLDKIELTASNLVDESIERAVSVTEEIKKEIDIELRESSVTRTDVEKKSKKSILKKEDVSIKSETKDAVKEVSELVELIDKTTEEIIKQKENSSDFSVTEVKEIGGFESISQNCKSMEEGKSSYKQELEEVIDAGSVKRKSIVFDKQRDMKTKFDEKHHVESINVTGETQVVAIEKDTKKIETKEKSVMKEEKETNETKISTSRLLAEQRAYTIGLQTIPNIRGSVHSSYHYNLLLKTFFIHLTDVMVALSRFILTEPVLSKEKSQDVVTSTTKNMTTEETVDKNMKGKVERKTDTEDALIVKGKMTRCDDIEEKTDLLDVKEVEFRKRSLSGSKMAQLTDNKSEELIQSMGAVISEFQKKTGIEETKESKEELIVHRDRRSRSRSKLEEEIMKDGDPLEWLSKVDMENQSQETNMNTDISNIITDSMERKTQSRNERETRSQSREGKNTYIAIVESHVYTNKDAILAEYLADSETASVQSIEENNIAFEVAEKFATESSLKKEYVGRKQELNVIAMEATNGYTQAVGETVKQSNLVADESIAQESSIIREQVTDVTAEKLNISTVKSKTESKVEVVDEEIKENKKIAQEKIALESSIMKDETKLLAIEAKSECIIQGNESVKANIEKKQEVLQENTELIKSVKNDHREMFVEESKKLKEAFEPAIALRESQTELVKQDKIKKMKAAEETRSGICEIEDINVETEVILSKPKPEPAVEFANLKVIKEAIIEIEQPVEIIEEKEVVLHKKIELSNIDTKSYAVTEQTDVKTSAESQEIIQESSFTAKTQSQSSTQKLSLDLSQERVLQTQLSTQSDENNNIDTPTPSTIPPTPLTDEYIFRLQIPLPRDVTPVPPDPSTPVDHEDPNIVKKKLIPHIETKIEGTIQYDPPLPTPPEGEKLMSPVYTKPGLKGGTALAGYKEDILEIERKSSLLASAIDQTIRSIQEYKESVGIDTLEYQGDGKTTDKKKNQKVNFTEDTKPVYYNGFAKVETKVYEKSDTENFDIKVNLDEDTKNTLNNSDLIRDTYKENTCQNNTSNVESKTNIIQSTTDVLAQDIVTNVINDETAAEESADSLKGFKSVKFEVQHSQMDSQGVPIVQIEVMNAEEQQQTKPKVYMTEDGEIIGTHQGIVDGLEDALVDEEVSRELGKPGMPEEKIAELISGEAEMLREAHVMGLTRVLSSHMHRNEDDDSSVDFQKIKPIVPTLKDSEVLKVLNEEMIKEREERKKREEKKWTTFLQKPNRPVPRAKFGYYRFTAEEEDIETPYKVKIVKQPKPKVAPDYKPEDFETGPLPWEERARNEPPPPPVEPEDPILIPEELPEFLEAVDPLPESEVPDLEDTGIPLPPEKSEVEIEQVEEESEIKGEAEGVDLEELDLEAVVEETEKIVVEMEQNKIAEQLIEGVQSMVDPNASLEQQLAQMRAQLAALAQLPGVIQQTLELVTKQLSQIGLQESTQAVPEVTKCEMIEDDDHSKVSQQHPETIQEETAEETRDANESVNKVNVEEVNTEDQQLEKVKQSLGSEELERLKMEEEEMLEERRRIEKQRKELIEQMKLEQEARQVKQRPTPRVGKPKPMFGPLTPQERPMVLPGGRRWRKPEDAYNEQFIAEVLTAQAEIIKGKAKGSSYESARLPYDERINFMKYEKPPVSLDHLQHSDVYKLIHDMEPAAMRRVDMLTPVIAECDYREKCRSVTPCRERVAQEQHTDIPEQVQP